MQTSLRSFIFMCEKAKGVVFFSPFLQFLTLSQSRQLLSSAVLRHWSWLRSELQEPLIISELNNFDDATKMCWGCCFQGRRGSGEEARQLPHSGFSAARSVLAAHSPCPCGDFWMVSGDVTGKIGFVSVPAICVSKDPPFPPPWFCSSVPTRNTVHVSAWQKAIPGLMAVYIGLDKHLCLMQFKSRTGFCLDRRSKTAQRGRSFGRGRRFLLKLCTIAFRQLRLVVLLAVSNGGNKWFLQSYSKCLGWVR